MCGQYVLTVDERFSARFGLDKVPDTLTPKLKAYPGAVMPVITESENHRSLEMLKWGMGVYNSFNARAETLMEKPTFAASFISRRCLIPVNGFFENKKFFTLKGTEWFSLAGIFHDGQYTMITTLPNSLIGAYHHRMPVVIDPAAEADWLTMSANEAANLLASYPAEKMELH